MYKVKSRIRENGKVYDIGSEYKGDNADNLLKSGALEFVKEQKKVEKKKVTKKKKTKKDD